MMEEGFYKAIMVIEAVTGKRPKRIEMPDGKFLVEFAGVELLLNASQAGYIQIKYTWKFPDQFNPHAATSGGL